uniref:Uncharacterized protein n=1 Tax=Schizaphis graminum TaxID=13262 RepID=A0A2S2P0F4_SCHGA
MRAYWHKAGGRVPGWQANERARARERETERERDGRGERNGIKTALARAKATGRSRFPQFTTADVRRARAATTVFTQTTHRGGGSRVLSLFFPSSGTRTRMDTIIISRRKRGWLCGC